MRALPSKSGAVSSTPSGSSATISKFGRIWEISRILCGLCVATKSFILELSYALEDEALVGGCGGGNRERLEEVGGAALETVRLAGTFERRQRRADGDFVSALHGEDDAGERIDLVRLLQPSRAERERDPSDLLRVDRGDVAGAHRLDFELKRGLLEQARELLEVAALGLHHLLELRARGSVRKLLAALAPRVVKSDLLRER